jgi:hypothetical protein
LVLLCVRGSKRSEKKEQNSCTDETGWFHIHNLRYGNSCAPRLLRRAPRFFETLISWSTDVS